MAILDPVRLDHAKRTLRSVVLSAVDDVVASRVVWMKPGVPRPDRPFVGLQLLAGPSSDGTIQDEKYYAAEVTSVDVTVDSAVASALYKVRVNGIPFDFISGVAPTVTTIRDGLIALINNTATPPTKQSEPVTATAGGAGDFSITPDSPGAIYQVEAHPAGLVSRVINSDNDLVTTHLIGRERMLFQVDVYTAGNPDNPIELTSHSIAAKIRKAFDLDANLQLTKNARVPLQVSSDIRELSQLEPGGAVYENRASFDVLGFISSRVAESTLPIEIAEITTNVDGNTETFTVDINNPP